MSSKIKYFLFWLLLVILFGLIMFFLFLLEPKLRINNFKEEVSFEYNEKIKYDYGVVCYGTFFSCKKIHVSREGKVDNKILGKNEISYVFEFDNNKYNLKQVINIVDTTPPKIIINEEIVKVCPNGKIPTLNIKAIDNYDGDITNNINKELSDNEVVLKVKDKNGNETISIIPAIVEDKEAPKIVLNGEKNKSFYPNSSYNDEGITVTDNCNSENELDLKIDNNVDYTNPGTYKITYSVTDQSNNTSYEQRNIDILDYSDNSKDVYLTFDDGPSIYTEELLDILKKYNVKATFFVTSNGSDSTILREYNEGHTVALHSNTHEYSYIYSSIDNYFTDLYAVQNRVKNITGESPNLIRFPGGSSNSVSTNYDGGIKIMSKLTEEVENKGFQYFDWNVSSGDAGDASTSDEVYYNVINNLSGGYSIVLQHDTKKFSIDAVERIIQYGLANGYVFKPLSSYSPKAHHRIYN